MPESFDLKLRKFHTKCTEILTASHDDFLFYIKNEFVEYNTDNCTKKYRRTQNKKKYISKRRLDSQVPKLYQAILQKS